MKQTIRKTPSLPLWITYGLIQMYLIGELKIEIYEIIHR